MEILKNLIIKENEYTEVFLKDLKEINEEIELLEIENEDLNSDDKNKFLSLELNMTNSIFNMSTVNQFFELIQKINKFSLVKLEELYIFSIEEY